MTLKHLLKIADLTPEEAARLLADAKAFKEGARQADLHGKTLALLFEKPSLRTRVSFDVAMYQLGGHCLYLSPAEVGLGGRESVQDVALVLSRFVDAIAARTFSQDTVEQLARYGSVPVINALSDAEHPCQGLADFQTMQEANGELKGQKLAFIGDGNNCATSLLYLAAMLGVDFSIASPKGYELPEQHVVRAQSLAGRSGARIDLLVDPAQAAKDADAIYTDVWTSMGQESEQVVRKKAFAPYQINEALMQVAKKDAIILHPLPAHHGEEVAEGIIHSARSRVFDQAENRLHAQKAVLAAVLEGR